MAEQDGIAECRETLELTEEALIEAETTVEEAETATQAAREREVVARGPLGDAQSLLQGYQTEARTLEQVLNVHSGQDHTPVVELLKVQSGFETALGAALGEDLDASLDAAAAVKWGSVFASDDDPALPGGAMPLADVVDAPQELRRRLAQIGVVDQQNGVELRAALKPGQRLVSKEGDLWRWDGFVIAANAPTPAAQRLAQKNRLAELEDEIEVCATCR